MFTAIALHSDFADPDDAPALDVPQTGLALTLQYLLGLVQRRVAARVVIVQVHQLAAAPPAQTAHART
jgi:hypothetical protein